MELRQLQAPRLTLLVPLLRAMQDVERSVRRAAAAAVLAKAQELLRLPATVAYGHGQKAGSLAAIRTASGDELEALLVDVLQRSALLRMNFGSLSAVRPRLVDLEGRCHLGDVPRRRPLSL